MNAVASVAGRADPLTAAIRSDDVSYFRRADSGSSRMRWSMTGTATSVVAFVSATARSARSGSNRECSTIVARSGIAAWSIA